MRISPAKLLARALAGLVLTTFACGFAFIKNDTTGLPLKWPPGTISLRIMVDNVTLLSDGTTRATSIQAAMQDPTRGWNQFLGDEQFTSAIFAPASGGDGNHLNEVFFSNTPYSMNWDSNTLAVTTAWYNGNQRTEADIIFNTAWTWDSYRGNVHSGVVDIQRVALHELGHVLGLDHPDDAGQTVSAVMNSHVGNLDSLASDDIIGGQGLYGPPGVPANNNFAAAILVVGNPSAFIFYNTNATKEPGEPNHAGNVGGRSVWWKWIAPSAGSVTLTTQGSLFDTTLGVYTGSAVNSLTTIASNDDVQPGVIQYSSVTFNANGGVTYYFAVDGFNANDGHGADSAAVTLNLTFSSSGTATTSTSSTSTSTTSTIPPTSSGGGGGGGGAPSVWFFGVLSLLACARRILPKKG